MKKVLLVAAVAMLALASCKKDYTCDCGIISQDYNGLNKDDAATLQTSCETGNICTWSVK